MERLSAAGDAPFDGVALAAGGDVACETSIGGAGFTTGAGSREAAAGTDDSGTGADEGGGGTVGAGARPAIGGRMEAVGF